MCNRFECLIFIIFYNRTLSQWPFIIGDRLYLSQHIFGVVTFKSFEALGWDEDSCSCSNSNAFPPTFYSTLLSFWVHCLEFQKQEQDVIHLSSAVYTFSDFTYLQKNTVICFTLSAGAYFQSIWSDKTDKKAAQVIHTFFSRYIEVLSLCLGNLPNLVTPHSLDSGNFRATMMCCMCIHVNKLFVYICTLQMA